jgi:O-antigen/teichoic acid export membrane protein
MSFLRQFFVYGLGGAASRFAAILLVPLYTRALPMEEYGRLEVLLAVHALVLIFAGLQAESSVAREYFDAGEPATRRGLIATAVQLALAGSLGIGLLLFVTWASGWFADTLTLDVLLPLIVLTLPAQLLGVQQVVLRFAGKPVFFAMLSFFDLASCAVFSVIYIVFLDMGVAGALWGAVTGKVLCVLVAWGRAEMTASLAPDRAWLRRVLAYGVPAIPAVLVAWLQNAGGRLLLAIALSLTDVAIASIAIKVAALYGFLVYSYRMAWEPYSVARFDQVANDPGLFTRALEWYVLTMFVACAGAALVGPYVTRLLAPPEYSQAGVIAVFFLVGQFWVGVTNVTVVGINAARRTDLLLPAYASGALLMVALLLALARPLGVLSAGVAFLAGTMCTAFMALYFGNRHYAGKIGVGLVSATAFGSVAFCLAWYFLLARQGGMPASLSATLWLLLAGLACLVAALALIVALGFGQGRLAAMFGQARLMLRARRS